MKLLLDQNLSPRLVKQLEDLYPGSAHVQDVELDHSQDEDVWSFAREGGFMIVTKDVDFSERSLVQGFPPKIVWIRRGNCPTEDLEKILRQSFDDVKKLYHDPQSSILVLL